ncbi:MAG: O-linked N-acetylglucosamine transferase, SPINDLY family protein [Planctomycetota bacterium]
MTGQQTNSATTGLFNPGENSGGFPAWATSAVESGRLDWAEDRSEACDVEPVLRVFQEEPSKAGFVFRLAEVLGKAGRVEEAERCYNKLLEAGPNALVSSKLGCLCEYGGRLSQALEHHKRAVQAEPQRPEVLANYARALMETGEMNEGIQLLRRALSGMPDNAQARSNYLLRLHQMPQLDRRMLFDEHKQWGWLHAPTNLAATNHQNDPQPDRKLRIGYVSPDFRRHSISYFFEPLLDGHNRRDVEVYGYGNVEFPDQITERLAGKFDCYRDIRDMDDDAAAQLIRRDKIDILVDLAGHVGDNRLLVLARRPAPIQVTYLGYPDTTGVEAIDYRFTDALADPPELGAQGFCTEELLYLGDGFLCYRPPDFAPPISSLQAEKEGYVTFGSFNNNCKINDTTIHLWAGVMRSCADSRLLLKLKGGDDPCIGGRYLERFEKAGIVRGRIEIHGWKPPAEHMQTYHRMDIALDTYPYHGTTTTCEALWMGVPTVSLVGQCHASRTGLSILTRVGLEFFAARTPEEYVAKAIALAGNVPALAQIRRTMRARIATSGLCYSKGFAARVEAACRRMWHRWCRQRGSETAST